MPLHERPQTDAEVTSACFRVRRPRQRGSMSHAQAVRSGKWERRFDMAEQACVSTQLDLRLVVSAGASLPVRAILTYDRTDPYAVTVAFDTAPHEHHSGDLVCWTFARSLLEQGVTRRVGDGDVKAWPAVVSGGQVVCLSLTSPSGDALFELPLRELVAFLTQSFAVVPSGSESDHVDTDLELALLLGAEPEA